MYSLTQILLLLEKNGDSAGCFAHSAFSWFMLLKNFMVIPSMENPELSLRPKIVHSLADMDKKHTSQAEGNEHR